MSTAALMANATRSVYYLVNVLFEQHDQRTKKWFFANTPWPMFTVLGAYLFFCVYAGPKFMRNRKAFELKKPMLVYNALQVVLSCVMFYEFYKGGWGVNYNYRCQPINFDTGPVSMRMANAVWLFYMAKLTELLDTVFFVLRKKDRQISFLHLYHHTCMPLAFFFAVQNYAGGHGTMMCFVNSFIHIVMYTYYMLTAMGPKVQKYLWWKKYITVLQILQFLFVFVHMTQIQFQQNCNYPKVVGAIISFNAVIFTYMFTSFYIKNYLKDKEQAALKRN